MQYPQAVRLDRRPHGSLGDDRRPSPLSPEHTRLLSSSLLDNRPIVRSVVSLNSDRRRGNIAMSSRSIASVTKTFRIRLGLVLGSIWLASCDSNPFHPTLKGSYEIKADPNRTPRARCQHSSLTYIKARSHCRVIHSPGSHRQTGRCIL